MIPLQITYNMKEAAKQEIRIFKRKGKKKNE